MVLNILLILSNYKMHCAYIQQPKILTSLFSHTLPLQSIAGIYAVHIYHSTMMC